MIKFNVILTFIFLAVAFEAMPQTSFKEKPSNDTLLTHFMALPSLDELLDSTMLHSPILKVQDEQIAIRELELARKRNQWLENVNIEGYARYANNNQIIAGSFDSGINAGLTTSTLQFLYGGGVTVKLPIFTFFSRGKDLRTARVQIKSSTYQREVLEQELRRNVITLYNQALLAHSLLEVKIGAMETSAINVSQGEIEFRNNRINFSDLSKIQDAHMKNRTEYEQALSDLRLSLELLQEISGYKFLSR